MSLLLLFPGGRRGWIKQSDATSNWSINAGDYKHIWSDWRTTTWGSLHSSGYTWTFVSGITFTVNTGQSTTWAKQPDYDVG